MKYIITKRTECEHDPSTFVASPYDNGTLASARSWGCPVCGLKGFTETHHDFDEVLLSRLAKLRWNPRFTDNGTEWDEFDGMEMQDDTTV